VNEALDLQPKNHEFLITKANLLQSALRPDEALSLYRRAALLATDPWVQTNIFFCQEIIRSRTPDGLYTNGILSEFYQSLITQRRHQEASVFLPRIDSERVRLHAFWSTRLAQIRFGGKLNLEKNGGLYLDAQNLIIPSLEPLRGLPLSRLNLGGSKGFTTLGPLSGMPLRELTLYGDISDLTPLKGLPLRILHLDGVAGVRDIKPLEGLPLDTLGLTYTRVTDLSPLRGMPLRKLGLGGLAISNLDSIAHLKLEHLDLFECRVGDIGLLANMPLQHLDASRLPVKDWTFLAKLPLKHLMVRETSFSDLTLITNLKLLSLEIGRTKVTDFKPLERFELLGLELGGLNITNLDFARRMPLENLYLMDCTNIADFSGLRDLKSLRNVLLPPTFRDFEILRSLTNLSKVGFSFDMAPVEQFISRHSK
jgi:hypothetical protein